MSEQIADKCRHFNGIYGGICEAGIRYESIRSDFTLKSYPCFKKNNLAERCSSCSFLSEEEVAAEVKRTEEHMAAFLTELAEGKTCPHCHAPIEKRRQVGRCVYAEPCGHRQYQGRLPKTEE